MNASAPPVQPDRSVHVELSPLEVLSPSVSIQRVVNTNVFLFTINALDRATVDVWIDRIILETEKQPDPKVPTFWLHDASASKTVSLSPYLRHRIAEMTKRFSDRIGYNAVIMPKTFVVQILVLFIRTMPIQSKNKLFFNREEGLRWLYEVAAPYQKPAPVPVGK